MLARALTAMDSSTSAAAAPRCPNTPSGEHRRARWNDGAAENRSVSARLRKNCGGDAGDGGDREDEGDGGLPGEDAMGESGAQDPPGCARRALDRDGATPAGFSERRAGCGVQSGSPSGSPGKGVDSV